MNKPFSQCLFRRPPGTRKKMLVMAVMSLGITSTNIAGKYSEKDGPKILIFHLVKTYLHPMLCHLLRKFSKIKKYL